VNTAASEEPRKEIVSAFSAMGTRYTRIRELTHYRYRLAGLFVVLFSLQEVAAFVLRKHARAALVPFRILTSVLWPLFAAYCAYVFLG
jgi:hypothetical protein